MAGSLGGGTDWGSVLLTKDLLIVILYVTADSWVILERLLQRQAADLIIFGPRATLGI